MVDPHSVLKYIGNFLGYGNVKSPFWFIGMEEGGGKRIDHRFQLWESRGCRRTEDLVEFHRQTGEAKWFLPPYPLQTTWRQLIRIYQNAHGSDSHIEAIREFQKMRLGRANISAMRGPCIFELMPLPSPSFGMWPYGRFAEQYQELAFLKNRKKYQDKVLSDRVQLLRNQIEAHKPRVVCFYGLKYIAHWKQISGTELSCRDLSSGDGQTFGIYYNRISDLTIFIAIAHPSARSVSNEYFNSVGQFIRSNFRIVTDMFYGQGPKF